MIYECKVISRDAVGLAIDFILLYCAFILGCRDCVRACLHDIKAAQGEQLLGVCNHLFALLHMTRLPSKGCLELNAWNYVHVH